MTMFWIVSACLMAGALLFLLPPVLQRSTAGPAITLRGANLAVYRAQLAELEADVDGGTLSPERYEASRRDLEQRLLHDVADKPGAEAPGRAPGTGRWAAALMAVLVPLGAVALYLQLGSPALIGPPENAGPVGGASHTMDKARIQQMVDGLARRLAANPQDPDGWIMLARSYTALGRYADAGTAYARAVALRPDDAQLLADHADTTAMLQGKRLAGAPAALIQRALRADPDNLKALALAGTEAYQRGDFGKAADYWQRLRKLVPAGSELESSVDANVQEARALAAGRNPRQMTQDGSAAASASDASAAAGRIAGTVRLNPSIAARASPEDTVFIYARATEGPRMPLAILRRQVRDLPASFALDDSLAMAPTLRLSGFREVVVGARVSRSGNAMPQAGDLEGTVRPVRVGATNVEIVIDAAVP